MRIFSRTGLVLCLGGILFLVATLLYPCMPFPDPMGATVFLSRFDYALVVLGHPEAVWEQWRGGSDGLFFFERIPILLRAAATIAICWSLGRLLVSFDKLESHLSRVAHFAISIITGYVLVNVVLFILQRWFRIDHWVWPASALLLCYVVLWLLKERCSFRLQWQQRDSTEIKVENDLTFQFSWKRRLFGLTSIGLVAVFCIQILGACIPTVDQEVRRDVWWRLVSKSREGRVDTTTIQREDAKSRQSWLSSRALPTIDFASALWLWESSHEKSPNHVVSPSPLPSFLTAMVTSKVMVTVVTWIGFMFLAIYSSEAYGKLPAIVGLMLLGCTPCFIELARLGRVESIYGISMASLPIVVQYSRRSGVVPIGCIAVLSLPLMVWMNNCYWTPSELEYLRPEGMARFVGFSTLYAVAFVPLVMLGVCSRKGRMERWMAAIAMIVFLIAGLLCEKMDRCWVPSLCLLSFAAIRGISIVMRDQPSWLGLPIWLVILLFAMVDGVALSTIDNRIFASYGEIVRSQWQYRESLSDLSEVSDRYTAELTNQWSDGKLGDSPRLLLVGEWDDLDLPMECSVWLDRPTEMLSQAVDRNSEKGITHIALVSSIDRNARLLSLEADQVARQELERLHRQGLLRKMDVSTRCRELTLYAVNFMDTADILSLPKSNP